MRLIILLLFAIHLSGLICAAEVDKSKVLYINNLEEIRKELPYYSNVTFIQRHNQTIYNVYKKLMPFFCKRYKSVCNAKGELDPPIQFMVVEKESETRLISKIVDDELRQTNIIQLDPKIFDKTISNQESLEFIVAHEMVHFFEGHGLIEDNKDKVLYIYSSYDERCIEVLEKPSNNDAILNTIYQFIDIIDYIGGQSEIIDEKVLIPVSGEFLSLMIRMAEKACSNQNQTLFDEIKELSIELESKYKSQKNILKKDTQYLEDKVKECFAYSPKSKNLLREIFEELSISMPINPKLNKEISAVLIDNNNQMNDFDRLGYITRLMNYQYRTLPSELGPILIPFVRLKTIEDLADETAIEILSQTGVEDLNPHLKYLRNQHDLYEFYNCKSYESKNQIPPYQSLSLLHPSLCWRIWRSKKYLTIIKDHKRASMKIAPH